MPVPKETSTTRTILNTILQNRKFFLVVGGLGLTLVEGLIALIWPKFQLDAIFIANAGLIGAYLGINLIQKVKVPYNENS